MADDGQLRDLLEQLLDSSRSPEEVCRDCPELLPDVREWLRRLDAVNGQLAGLFPAAHAATPAASPPPANLPQVPGYELVELLGHGGMGLVYKARQMSVNRVVALKMILARQHASLHAKVRFQIEAEAIARLTHPHIVQLYESGDCDGTPYFSLEFCGGGSLARKLVKGQAWPAREAAALVEKLARATHAAHLQGVIHRDLKPGNVLLTDGGEPKITDFGLAKRLDITETITQSGEVMGTLAYMAPEQAAGQVHAIGPATDVYALGVILYQLLAGRLPFEGPPHLVPADVAGREPTPLSRLTPRIPRDLQTICFKCLAKEPARRFDSAQALADDLRRFLDGEPISARPVSARERAIKWARRRPAAAVFVALMFVILAGLAVATGLLMRANQREREAKQQAITARLDAEQKEREADQARRLAEEKRREAIGEREKARRQGQAAKEVAHFLEELFQTSDPIRLQGVGFRSGRQNGAELTARQLLEAGSMKVKTQLKNQPLVQAAMLDTLGNVHRSLGLLQEAGTLLEQGLAIRRGLLGEGHEDTASSLHHLAWLYHDQGKYPEAEVLCRQALAIRQKQLGEEDLATAATMFNLAWMLTHQDKKPTPGRMDETEELFRRVVKIRRQHLPPGHTATAQALVGLGFVLWARPDRGEEAKRVMIEAAAVLARGDNKDRVTNAFLKYFLAAQARQARRYDEAEKLYRSVLAMANGLLGEGHPLVGFLLGDLAGLLRQKGDLEGARETIYKALDIGRRAMVHGHPLMIQPLLELGDHERSRGQLAEAEKLFREALDIAQRFDRRELADRARTKLVHLLREQQRHEEAAALMNAVP
jgi:tetratricopeptide (TPR) repeat protein/tRNA A-37 threonylcarbamoyl transferase component Bud32